MSLPEIDSIESSREQCDVLIKNSHVIKVNLHQENRISHITRESIGISNPKYTTKTVPRHYIQKIHKKTDVIKGKKNLKFNQNCEET